MKTQHSLAGSGLMIILLLFYSFTSLAQVATPSLNPTTPVYLPAASGWRTVPSIGTNYFDRIGTRSYQNVNIYEFTGSGYSANLNFGVGEQLGFSANYSSEETQVSKDVYYEGEINLSATETQVNLTLSHEGFAVFGLGSRNYTTKDYISDIYPDEVTTQISTIPGMSIRLGNVFYIGAGMEIVKASGRNTVDNHWINTIGGLAIMTDKNEGVQFRIEASATNSPEATATAKQGKEASEHNKTVTARGALEMQYKGLVVEAFTVDTRESVDIYDASSDTELTEIHTVSTQFGFLIAPDDGIVLGFHFRSDLTENIYTDKHDSFVISLAYNFGGPQ